MEKTVSDLGLGDFKGESFKEDGIGRPGAKSCQQQSLLGRTGHGDSKTSRPQDGPCSQADGEDLEAIQDAAKFIVDITLFLTTQIVYPAYVRYLQEDHPEVYIQYYGRPETPIPWDEKHRSSPTMSEDAAKTSSSSSTHLDYQEEQPG